MVFRVCYNYHIFKYGIDPVKDKNRDVNDGRDL